MLKNAVKTVEKFSQPLVWGPAVRVVARDGKKHLVPETRQDAAWFDAWLPSTNLLPGGEATLIAMAEDRIRIHGMGVGHDRQNNHRLEAFFTAPDSGPRRIERILAQAMGLEPGDIRAIQTTGFHAQLTAGYRGRHEDAYAFGTIGGYVRDSDDGVFALSNNHVFALSNDGNTDDDLVSPSPSAVFGGLKTFVRLREPPKLNDVDAAIGWIYDDESLDAAFDLPSRTRQAEIGMPAVKYGRSSKETFGEVKSIGSTAQVSYPGLGSLNFRRLIRIEAESGLFTIDGDSGSLVRENGDNAAIGLHFAGDRLFSSLACKIQTVLKELKVALYDGD